MAFKINFIVSVFSFFLVCILTDILQANESDSEKDLTNLLDFCDANWQCGLKLDDHKKCIDGNCQCKDGYVMDSDLKHCISSSISISIDKCSQDDFNQGDETCTLRCTVNANATSYHLQSHNWTYALSMPKSEHILIFGAKYDDSDTEQIYESSLTLTNYSSGIYICQFLFIDDSGKSEEIYGGFKISPERGILLNEECEEAWECGALNAKCDNTTTKLENKTCNCNGYHNIPYYPIPLSPACLAQEPETAYCNIDDQCYRANQSIYCENNICTCTGNHTTVKEINNEDMCVIPAYIGALCYYNEQCTIINENTYCDKDRSCHCKDGFVLNKITYICESKLSSGAIAGIVIGCIAAAIIILSLIVYVVK
ncbi:hypothetical protein CHUAL_007451 [Chamberlinius hualienensis]